MAREVSNSLSDDSVKRDCDKGWALFDEKEDSAAEELFKASLAVRPSAQAHCGLGYVYSRQGRDDEAVMQLREAIKLDISIAKAYAALCDIFLKRGQGFLAIENCAQAVAADPSNDTYKQNLIAITHNIRVQKMNDNLKGVLLECLETPGLVLVFFGRAWLSILKADKKFLSVYKLSKHKKYSAFKNGFMRSTHRDALIDPFFLTGLGLFVITDTAFERWCMHLRRFLLEAQSKKQRVFSDEEDADFVTCALSRFSALTDYILNESEQEKPLILALQEKIEQTANPRLQDLALFGCYRPLCTLKNAQDIAKNLRGGEHVSQIPKSQIEDYFRQKEIEKSIPALTEIKDEVSSAVQEQYEEFPYPRWVSLPKNLFDEEAEGYLKDKKAQILVAGCGTGREAMQLAFVFPDAEILAVDLSKASLAYAIDKSHEYQLKNVTFMQADIMELEKLDKKFDYIASAGVLHHMSDPKAGWKILTGLLKPGGLMRIGLYSRIARRALTNAQNRIKQEQIGSDADSIRTFRKNAGEYLKPKVLKDIEGFFDYYSLPECRDLLFHVQEHQFDLNEIKDILDELDLEFVKFYLSQSVIEEYRKNNPEDEQAQDLSLWAEWEEKNPGIFREMYRFWCRKKG